MIWTRTSLQTSWWMMKRARSQGNPDGGGERLQKHCLLAFLQRHSRQAILCTCMPAIAVVGQCTSMHAHLHANMVWKSFSMSPCPILPRLHTRGQPGVFANACQVDACFPAHVSSLYLCSPGHMSMEHVACAALLSCNLNHLILLADGGACSKAHFLGKCVEASAHVQDLPAMPGA